MNAPPTPLVLEREPVSNAGLRLRDLGSLGVQVDGVDIPIRGAKPTRILATLLINANHRVSIDALLDAVWGEQVSDSTLGSLESHIWRMRKLMEPNRGRRQEPTYLVNDSGGGYRLIVNPDNADSLRFVQLAGQGDRLLAAGDSDRALRRYELALTLWRGQPFEPVADQEWAAAPIARLLELHGQLNEQRIEAMLRLGAADRAIGELETLIGRLPFRERLWSQLMLGLYHAGRVEEALGAYHRAREILLDAMGIEPGTELRQLQQRILGQDPSLIQPRPSAPGATSVGGATSTNDATTVPGAGDTEVRPGSGPGEVHLPTRLTSLVGRADELDRIGRLLTRSRLVTVVGPAGGGKTRLAIEVAKTAADVAPDGVWFLDLASVEEPAAIVDLVVSTIGLEQPAVGSALSGLRSYVRDRKILLLVDNCEHLLPAVHVLFDALLDADSECRILATSRDPIGLDGEVLWTLAPLAVRDAAAVSREDLSPAAQLFLVRAQSTDPLFDPTAEAIAEIEAICAAVDGIPLAIELAAGRIRSASLAEVHHQVTTELADLSRVGYARTEHHRTVELSIDWSVRLLSDAERTVHARLSVFPGLFTVEAARAVAGVPPVQPEDVSNLLTQLAHHSLLAVAPGAGADQPTRFRQLATVRAHATRALNNAGDSTAALNRRTAWVADLVATGPPPHAEDTTSWYDRIERNHDTLAAVLRDTLGDRHDPLGVRLVGQLAAYWLFRHRISEGARWLDLALSQTGASEPDRRLAELTLAYLRALRGRTDLTQALVNNALNGERSVEPRLFARGLVLAAWCASFRGGGPIDFVAHEVTTLAGEDPIIEFWAELLASRAALATEGPVAVGTRAEQLARQAGEGGNLHAAWLASSLAVSCAVLTKDVATGQARLQELKNRQRRMGAALTPAIVESDAYFAALDADHERAVQLFGKASAMMFRENSPWPLIPATEAALTQLKGVMTAERFDAAWRIGETLPDPTW